MSFRYVAVYECDGCGTELTFDMKDAQQLGTPMQPETGWEQVQCTNMKGQQSATLVYCPNCYGDSDFGRAIGANYAKSVGTDGSDSHGTDDGDGGGVPARI